MERRKGREKIEEKGKNRRKREKGRRVRRITSKGVGKRGKERGIREGEEK